jgi:hypothetical protein
MIEGKRKMAPPSGEALMLVPDVFRQIREGGAKRIAEQLGVARATVWRYAGCQAPRKLTPSRH